LVLNRSTHRVVHPVIQQVLAFAEEAVNQAVGIS
jgi:hypothetical protein